MADEENKVDAYIGTGSNIEPEKNIPEALLRLGRLAQLTGISTFYRTAPLDRPEQPPFLNGVVRIETALPPRGLKFQVLRKIESDLGRVRTGDKNASRVIDLDILLYGDAVVNEPDLRIPDPDIRTRTFLARPLLDLAPGLILPDSGERLDSLFPTDAAFDSHPVPEFTERLKARCLQ